MHIAVSSAIGRDFRGFHTSVSVQGKVHLPRRRGILLAPLRERRGRFLAALGMTWGARDDMGGRVRNDREVRMWNGNDR